MTIRAALLLAIKRAPTVRVTAEMAEILATADDPALAACTEQCHRICSTLRSTLMGVANQTLQDAAGTVDAEDSAEFVEDMVDCARSAQIVIGVRILAAATRGEMDPARALGLDKPVVFERVVGDIVEEYEKVRKGRAIREIRRLEASAMAEGAPDTKAPEGPTAEDPAAIRAAEDLAADCAAEEFGAESGAASRGTQPHARRRRRRGAKHKSATAAPVSPRPAARADPSPEERRISPGGPPI